MFHKREMLGTLTLFFQHSLCNWLKLLKINNFGESHLSLMILSPNLNMTSTKVGDYQQILVNHINSVRKSVGNILLYLDTNFGLG